GLVSRIGNQAQCSVLIAQHPTGAVSGAFDGHYCRIISIVVTFSFLTPPGCNCSSPGTAGPLKWESKLGEAFTHEVDYTDNGSLLIKHEGFYYIYSKVFYGEIACKQKPTYFSHAIYKKMPSYKKEIELMLMKKFYCIDSSGQWLANSYLGGVFHLQPDEEIYVKVDNKELVRLGTAENFFGVFQV
uniref:THD domain-containing protein n=1 Tax=Erpetoichthys calabaricus TaxID=27687 RepID=A0A8C4TDN1_ERPCA